jgi:hypothetical protein
VGGVYHPGFAVEFICFWCYSHILLLLLVFNFYVYVSSYVLEYDVVIYVYVSSYVLEYDVVIEFLPSLECVVCFLCGYLFACSCSWFQRELTDYV